MMGFAIEGSEKEVVYKIEDLKGVKVAGAFRSGARLITVTDTEAGDVYSIRLQKANVCGVVKVGGICALNRRASYQADFTTVGDRTVINVVNAIAGGQIINDNGDLIA